MTYNDVMMLETIPTLPPFSVLIGLSKIFHPEHVSSVAFLLIAIHEPI